MTAAQNNTVYSEDLAGIEVGSTAICDVQGEAGVLTYRGHSVEELAAKPFIDVAWLVLFGDWPDAGRQSALHDYLARHRRLTESEVNLLRALPTALHPMLMLQSVVPALAVPDAATETFSADAVAGLFIAAKIPSLLAAWHRLSQGLDIIPPNPALSPNADFLQMFHGCAATPQQISTLDAAQILQMEHSFNVSTFAGRICASTEAPLQSVIAASVGTLFGVLHGGADQAALEMARDIGSADKAAAYVAECLANKVKIMGMGHREYRVVDPRAKVLKPMAQALCTAGESRQLLETLCAVEAACQQEFAKRGKQIRANVEFYKGAVFHSLGIPDQYFTALFTMARVFGWVAHYLEFKPDSRLIRPRAKYVGK